MKKLVLLSLFVVSLVVGYAGDKPNVVVILADDIGVGDIARYRKMHSDNIILQTPNIDGLAAEGIMFTQAHSPAALCAPSRYGMMVGRNCYRSSAPWGVWGSYQQSPIRTTDLTLGRLMQGAGYQTAFFGKWHLGGDYYKKGVEGTIYRQTGAHPLTDVDITKIIDGPQQKGFDYSFTFPAGVQDVPYAVYENGEWMKLAANSEISLITQAKMDLLDVKLDKEEGLGDSNWNPHDMGPLLVNKAVDYINTNANGDKPFFMYYCSQAVHLPHTPPTELNGVLIAGTTPSRHIDMIKELDVQMGMIITALKEQGVYDNTLFIFTSDNGGLVVDADTRNSGHKSSDIYRGAKNSKFEGGQIVPFIARWPNHIEAGRVADNRILALDVLATLAAITEENIPADQAQDSYNLLPILENTDNTDSHPFILLQSGTGKQLIIIEDGWKLIIQVDKSDKTDNTRNSSALYDLNTDPRENNNRLTEYPERVTEMFNKYNTTRNNGTATGKSVVVEVPIEKPLSIDLGKVSDIEMNVFPNPSSGNLVQVVLATEVQQALLTVRDLKGNVVHTRQVNGSKFNIAVSELSLATGVYWITVKDKQNLITSKLVLQ